MIKVLQRVTYSCTVDQIIDIDLRTVACWAAKTCLIRQLVGAEINRITEQEIYWTLLKNSGLRTELSSQYAKSHSLFGTSQFS